MDDEWTIPDGHVLVKCPTCRYTNDVPAEMASNAKYVGDNCERCKLPAVERVVMDSPFHPLSDDVCEQIIEGSVVRAAREAQLRLPGGDIGIADVLAMVARETMRTTFHAMSADEEYLRAAEAVARRHQGRDPEGRAGVVAQPDGAEQGPDGASALGPVSEQERPMGAVASQE